MPPASSVSNDANSFMPLLFAAHPEIVPHYKRMAAMDDKGRTASALEHKFRNWRQEGKKIAADRGGTVDSVDSTPKKTAAAPKKTLSVRGGGAEKKNITGATPGKGKNKKDSGAEEAEDEDREDGDAAGAQLKADVGLPLLLFAFNSSMNKAAR